jgi:glycosyltransferase involved in cell wall biosynthesis
VKRIAICLATYNGQDFIKEQVKSIIPQLNSGDRIFCSDDGSADQTLKIMSAYDEIKIINYRIIIIKNMRI